jgi:Protein of unknown function (DUF3891)
VGHRPLAAAAEDPLIRHHYLTLQVWDRLSLQFAFRHACDDDIAPLPRFGRTATTLQCRSVGTMALRLDPYPFVESTTALPVKGYLVPDRPYLSPEDFVSTLAGAPASELECRATRQ